MSDFYLSRDFMQDINCTKHLEFKPNYENLENYINKASILGFNIQKVEKDVYIVNIKDTMILVTKNKICMPKYSNNLFEQTDFKSIDLKGLDSSKTIEMSGMFLNSYAEEIKNINKLDLSFVSSMRSMFAVNELKRIDLSNLKTPRLENTCRMFLESTIDELDITNLDFSTIQIAAEMFGKCEIKRLKINTLNFSDKVFENTSFTSANILNIIAPEEIRTNLRRMMRKTVGK